MEEVLSFLSSLDESEVKNMLTFLKIYIESTSNLKRTSDRVSKQHIQKLRNLLSKDGLSEKDIEHRCILKMLELGVITYGEAEDRLDCLNRAVF